MRSFVEVYDIIHPLDPPSVRDLRVSPFHTRQRELGAVFGEAAGWERPLWYEANAGLPRVAAARDDWSARHWSPIAAAEAQATRERVALYDMTPLTRLEVTGPVSFLQGLSSNDLDRPVGTVVYTLLLDEAGGIRSDVTVARLAEDRFQVGVNGPLDLDWLLRHTAAGRGRSGTSPARPAASASGGRCARDLVAPLADIDVSHGAFGYFKARQRPSRRGAGHHAAAVLRGRAGLGGLHHRRAGPAAVGHAVGGRCRAGRRSPAGRAAFNSLRLEKGYRAWGTDMTAEDDPYEAGLGFRRPAGPRRLRRPGRAAGPAAAPAGCCACLVLDDEGCVPMGREPVYADGKPAGFVTSAAYGHTMGAPIAYAWLPAEVAVPGTAVQVGYFDRLLSARVADRAAVRPET